MLPYAVSLPSGLLAVAKRTVSFDDNNGDAKGAERNPGFHKGGTKDCYDRLECTWHVDALV